MRARTHAHDWIGRAPDRTVTDTENKNETENAAEARKNVGMQPSLPLNLLGRPKKISRGLDFRPSKVAAMFFWWQGLHFVVQLFSTCPIRLNLFLRTSILPHYPTDGMARIFFPFLCCNRESNSCQLS